MIDCLIVGAGPAGLTAAIYLQRFHRDIRVVDGNESRARNIALSHNYPGYPDGLNGQQFLDTLRKQLSNAGGELTYGVVNSLQCNADGSFSAGTTAGNLTARTVLWATGVVDIEPEIRGYAELRQKDLVRFCPICDGFEYSDQRVAVLGNGLHGQREAEFILTFTDKVSYISLADEDTSTSRPFTMLDGKGGRLQHQDGEIGLILADGSTRQFDVLYCALGCHVRSNPVLALGAEHNEQKCLVVDDHLETSIRGLFAAGDVVSGLQQLAVATGQGAIAATAIHNRLRE